MDAKTAIQLAREGKLKEPALISPQAQNRQIWGGDVILCQNAEQRKQIKWREGQLILTFGEFTAACNDIKNGIDLGGLIKVLRQFGGGHIEAI